MNEKSTKGERTRLHGHGWVLGIIMLLYSSFAAYDYVMSIAQGEAYYKASGMTEAQVEYFLNTPVWATLAWTVSVWGMLVAAISLLIRFKSATLLFSISLAGTLLYMLYTFILSEGREAMGAIWPAPFVIAAITAAMIFYCKRLFRKGSST